MTAPFMIFKDRFETTLLVDETDFRNLRGNIGGAKVEGGFRLLTFDVELNFSVVGFSGRNHADFSGGKYFNRRALGFLARSYFVETK